MRIERDAARRPHLAPLPTAQHTHAQVTSRPRVLGLNMAVSAGLRWNWWSDKRALGVRRLCLEVEWRNQRAGALYAAFLYVMSKLTVA